MKQEELMKERLLAGVSRIYEHDEVNPLLAQQIVSFLPRYEQFFAPTASAIVGGLSVSARVKLYELLETLVSLDNLIVNLAIKDKRFAEFIMVSLTHTHACVGRLRTLRLQLACAALAKPSDPGHDAAERLL